MPKLLSKEAKRDIVILRESGHSIPEISDSLKISKATALRYAEGVLVKSEFKQRLLDRRNASKIISERAWANAHQKAKELVNNITDKERMLIACALYWAEGNKKDLIFTNTNAEMVAIFMDILRSNFQIKNSDFKISIRVYEDLNKEKCIKFWSSITKINLQDNVSINILKGKKKGKLEYGMCRVRIKKGGLLLKTIFAINKRISSIISPHSSSG
jgi:hypothetical protein